MPTDTSAVGGLTLPIPAGGQDSALTDPVLVGLLDYLAHYLRASLNTKLAEMRGPTSAAAVSDVAPASRLYPWDHDGTWSRVIGTADTKLPDRLPQPAMWGWSGPETPDTTHSTIANEAVKRTLSIEWIFPELQVPDGTNNRAGLQHAVAATLWKAEERNRHETWAANAQVHETLGIMGWRILDCVPGRLQTRPQQIQQRQSQGGTGDVKRYHPCVRARIEVVERIGDRTMVDPDDVLLDFTLDMNTAENGDPDTVTVLSRIAPGPDGS